jgi:hypothetical protein
LLILPLVLLATMVILGAVQGSWFHALIDEDRPIEWLQFFAVLAASGAFALASLGAHRTARPGLRAIYAVVAIASFLAAGEEISWGQRLLGFATPVGLEVVNHQGEANLHNISVVQSLFNLGELVAGLYGAAIPLLWLQPRIRAWAGRWVDPLLIPPLCLAVAFLLPFGYRLIRLVLLPDAGERIVELGEVPELTFYVGTLVTGVVTARVLGARAAGRAVGPIGPATPAIASPIVPPGG